MSDHFPIIDLDANPVEQQILSDIAANGSSIVHYAPSSEDDPQEVFSYTVGLTKTLGWPEIILFGLPVEQANILIASAIKECWERQSEPHAGMSLNKVMQGFSAHVTAFDAKAPRYFHFADWYAQRERLGRMRRVQLVWPDRAGKFPGEEGCDPEVAERQTPKDGQ